MIPLESDTVANHPKGFVTFFKHRFTFGLSLPLHPFFLEVCRRYGVPFNQLHPNIIKYIVCFFVVCKSVDIEPRPKLFAISFR